MGSIKLLTQHGTVSAEVSISQINSILEIEEIRVADARVARPDDNATWRRLWNRSGRQLQRSVLTHNLGTAHLGHVVCGLRIMANEACGHNDSYLYYGRAFSCTCSFLGKLASGFIRSCD